MRYGFRIGCALALSLALMAGCSDESGEGGSGGTGGTAGSGGTDPCEAVTCDAECKTGGVCDSTNGTCDYDGVVENGTACSEGECLDGVCAPVGAFPCTEQGIRDGIAEGGGPRFFACDGPTTVKTEATIDIDTEVILDGEGNLTVNGNDDHTLFDVNVSRPAELRRFRVTGGMGDSSGISAGGIEVETSNGGTLAIVDSTISDNVGQAGGGIVLLGGALTLINSTVSDNAAFGGGGIWIEAGSVAVINSTLSGNTGGQGSAVGAVPASAGPSALMMVSSTVVASREAPFSGSGMTVTLANTLLDSDCDQIGEFSTPPDVVSLGRNLESPGDTCGFDINLGDQVNVTAEQLNLGPLADNGGPTMTHALLTEPTVSVAIDAIPAEDCVDADEQPLTEDQRGEPRPETGGTMCDVGAFEVQP